MAEPSSFDYAIIRVVPRVEREEFINAGVILYCLQADFLEARVALNRERLLALDPKVDLAMVEAHLTAIPRICQGGPGSGPIGQLPKKERFHWLVAPRSTIVQVSPVHSGVCDSPQAALDRLVEKVVR